MRYNIIELYGCSRNMTVELFSLFFISNIQKNIRYGVVTK